MESYLSMQPSTYFQRYPTRKGEKVTSSFALREPLLFYGVEYREKYSENGNVRCFF